MQTQAFIAVTAQPIPYYADTTAIFNTLCQPNSNSLLLDSAEIGSKNSLQSLILVNAAVKITCLGHNVTFKALNENGKQVLKEIHPKLTALGKVSAVNFDDKFSVQFSPLDNQLDEDSKLQSATIFDGLRVVSTLYQHSQTPIFLGGLFAYDLVANFIPMDGITLQNDGINCPDYSFYLAEHLITIDHKNQQATLKSFCFAQEEQVNIAKTSLSIAQKLKNIDNVLSIKAASDEVKTNFDDPESTGIVKALKHHINIGDVFQIVPSRRFSLACPNTLASYAQLKQNNLSPYMFYMNDEDFILFGASPESALKYEPENRQLEIYPIAGSRPRGFPANIHTIRTPIIEFSKNFIVIISELSISKKIVEETNPSINFCKPNKLYKYHLSNSCKFLVFNDINRLINEPKDVPKEIKQTYSINVKVTLLKENDKLQQHFNKRIIGNNRKGAIIDIKLINITLFFLKISLTISLNASPLSSSFISSQCSDPRLI